MPSQRSCQTRQDRSNIFPNMIGPGMEPGAGDIEWGLKGIIVMFIHEKCILYFYQDLHDDTPGKNPTVYKGKNTSFCSLTGHRER